MHAAVIEGTCAQVAPRVGESFWRHVMSKFVEVLVAPDCWNVRRGPVVIGHTLFQYPCTAKKRRPSHEGRRRTLLGLLVQSWNSRTIESRKITHSTGGTSEALPVTSLSST